MLPGPLCRTLLLLLLPAAPCLAQSADEIIRKHVEARGGRDAWKAVKTLRLTGTASFGPTESRFVIETKRPGKIRNEVSLRGNTITLAWDGEDGWQLSSLGKSAGPADLTGRALENLVSQAEFEGILIDYREKGHRAEYLGTEDLGGRKTHRVRVVLADGQIEQHFFDASTFLELRREIVQETDEGAIKVIALMSDHEEVDGLVISRTILQKIEGAPGEQRVHLDKVEVNPVIPDARFRRPGAVE